MRLESSTRNSYFVTNHVAVAVAAIIVSSAAGSKRVDGGEATEDWEEKLKVSA
jgi:hypothetical protein